MRPTGSTPPASAQEEKKPLLVLPADLDFPTDRVYVLKLNKAIDATTGLISQLEFQPLVGDTVWDLPVEGAQTIGEVLSMAAKQTGLVPSDMRKVGADDLMNLIKVVAVFMRPFQQTS